MTAAGVAQGGGPFGVRQTPTRAPQPKPLPPEPPPAQRVLRPFAKGERAIVLSSMAMAMGTATAMGWPARQNDNLLCSPYDTAL